jgi:hypothetical protein
VLGLDRNTTVVFTSDHGEMGGAHELRGWGLFAYEEALHLPFYVVHPEVGGGQACRYRLNLSKRGSLRSVFDGRYMFRCYFAPLQRNQPKNLDELYRQNDVELFHLGRIRRR